MSVTIEEVMHKAVVYAREVRDGNDENCWERDELRAAIEALVARARDEEAGACAEIVMAEQATPHGLAYCEAAIRARIAERQGE